MTILVSSAEGSTRPSIVLLKARDVAGFLRQTTNQNTRPWTYSEWKASKDIVDIRKGGDADSKLSCDLVSAFVYQLRLRLLTYKGKFLIVIVEAAHEACSGG
jgi:hypothetical protein